MSRLKPAPTYGREFLSININCPRCTDGVVVHVAADACRSTVLAPCRNRQCVAVAAERDSRSEFVVGIRIGSLQIGALRPRWTRSREHIRRPRFLGGEILLIRIQPTSAAGLKHGR